MSVTGIGRCLITTHVILLLFLIVLSLFYYIPLNVLMKDFGGNCPLFVRGRWIPPPAPGTDTTDKAKIDWKYSIYYFGSKGACNLNMFLSILIGVSSCILLFPMGYHAYKKTDLSWLFVFLGTCFIIPVLILTGTAVLIITAGFKIMCLQLTSHSHEHCRKMQFEDFLIKDQKFYTKRFYDVLSVAEFGGWSSVIVLVTILCCYLRQLALYGQREAFMVSLQRERDRFLRRFHLDEGYVPV